MGDSSERGGGDRGREGGCGKERGRDGERERERAWRCVSRSSSTVTTTRAGSMPRRAASAWCIDLVKRAPDAHATRGWRTRYDYLAHTLRAAGARSPSIRQQGAPGVKNGLDTMLALHWHHSARCTRRVHEGLTKCHQHTGPGSMEPSPAHRRAAVSSDGMVLTLPLTLWVCVSHCRHPLTLDTHSRHPLTPHTHSLSACVSLPPPPHYT
jgi:hypothetical protein